MARSRRFIAPVAVAGLIAAGAAVLPNLHASAAPKLPSISAAKLLAKADSSHVRDLSGTVQWTANLGFPSLDGLTNGAGQSAPSSSSGFKATSLVSGTHTFKVWVAGQSEQRVAVPGQLAESDFVRHGNQAWLWDSSTAKVTHLVLASSSSPMGRDANRAAAPQASLSPQAVAHQVLTGLHRSDTTVSVSTPQRIAGRAAYVLRLSPDRAVAANRGSTVASVDIAVDAHTGLPLRVSVYAEGQKAPALQVGYTSLSLATPAAADFAIPHGTTVKTKVLRAHPVARSEQMRAAGTASRPTVVGSRWGSVVDLTTSEAGSMTTSPELNTVTKAVSGSWGSGRLLHSALLNALLLPDGHVLVGFTTPATLEQAARTAR